jgi:hypothetical protein
MREAAKRCELARREPARQPSVGVPLARRLRGAQPWRTLVGNGDRVRPQPAETSSRPDDAGALRDKPGERADGSRLETTFDHRSRRIRFSGGCDTRAPHSPPGAARDRKEWKSPPCPRAVARRMAFQVGACGRSRRGVGMGARAARILEAAPHRNHGITQQGAGFQLLCRIDTHGVG